jgi:ribonuclease P protein component
LDGGIIIYAKANLSTEQSTPRQDARLSRAHGDQERPPGDQTPPRQRPQALNAGALLKQLVLSLDVAPVKVSEALPQQRRLRARAQFQKIYAEGQRYDGRLLAAFLRKSESSEHRLGVTASTKAIGNAVARNRARRLLRELFRRSGAELNSLQQAYDWVLNAKRSLLLSNEEQRFREFRKIIAQVAQAERRGADGAVARP